MSTPQEQMEAIRAAIEVSKLRLHTLNTKYISEVITEAELYEREMLYMMIESGEKILLGSAT